MSAPHTSSAYHYFPGSNALSAARTQSLLAQLQAINDRVSIPTIASGGVGNLQHLADGILKGGADAVLAASIFHFGQHTIPEAKQYLAAQGIEMRL